MSFSVENTEHPLNLFKRIINNCYVQSSQQVLLCNIKSVNGFLTESVHLSILVKKGGGGGGGGGRGRVLL